MQQHRKIARRRRLRSSWLSSAEGDSPQCGEMSRRDKGAGHPLNRGQAAPCKEWTICSNKNLREIGKCCSPFWKHKKILVNYNLRKIHNQFGQHNHWRTAQRQRAKRICRTGFGWYPKEQFAEPHAIGFPRIKNTKEDSHNRNPLFFCIFTLSELVSEREPVHDCTRLSTAVWCCMFLLCKILSTMS